jgi:hypothetical protein
MPINWQDVITALGGDAVLLAAAGWLIQKLVSNRLTMEAEKFKIEIQAKADTEIERLRHLLSSRISKIHEKEFEILPKAWFMLHDAHGAASYALAGFKGIPDFPHYTDAQFEEFLIESRLSHHQKDASRPPLRPLRLGNQYEGPPAPTQLECKGDSRPPRRRLLVSLHCGGERSHHRYVDLCPPNRPSPGYTGVRMELRPALGRYQRIKRKLLRLTMDH